eukprot:gene34381-biopygen28035
MELVASAAEQHADRDKHRDIHDDELCLRWLKSNGNAELPEGEARRVKRRAVRHRWDEVTDEIYMITLSGKEVRIPKPADRLALVREYHARTGHWEIRLCVPIPNKEVSTIAAAFRNNVLAVFGAPAECLVDGGKEFAGEFQQLCRDCLIDRRVTSPDSPEGNGLTERVVRTIKFCFKKIALEKGLDYEWDEQLWPLVLSYNAARQESTGVTPFTLLFAQEAVVPPDLKHAPNLDFDLEV